MDELEQIGMDIFAHARLKKIEEGIIEIQRQLAKQPSITKTPTVVGMKDMIDLLTEIRLELEMMIFSNLETLFAIARGRNLASRIYFDADTGDINAGGSWSYTYNIPSGFVDVAEELGWHPSAARVLDFIWERDGSIIFEAPNTVRRERKVYLYDAEAYDYCKLIFENNDTTYTHRAQGWGKCHFLDKRFYDLIKRRTNIAYPPVLYPELDEYK